jgi:hypothetical protein
MVERLLKNVMSECSRVGLLVQKPIHGTDAPSYTDIYIPSSVLSPPKPNEPSPHFNQDYYLVTHAHKHLPISFHAP